MMGLSLLVPVMCHFCLYSPAWSQANSFVMCFRALTVPDLRFMHTCHILQAPIPDTSCTAVMITIDGFG